MTTAVSPALSPSMPTPGPSVPAPDFERRWNEWKTRGVAHEARTRGRARLGAALAGFALLAAAAYWRFAS